MLILKAREYMRVVRGDIYTEADFDGYLVPSWEKQ